MAVYNTTNLTSANNFLEFAQAVNLASEYWMGIMLYLSVLIIVFITLKTRSAAKTGIVMATTAWFSLIFSVILYAVKFIPSYFIVLSVVGVALFTGLMFVNGGQD